MIETFGTIPGTSTVRGPSEPDAAIGRTRADVHVAARASVEPPPVTMAGSRGVASLRC